MIYSNTPKTMYSAFIYCLNILFLLIYLPSTPVAKEPCGNKKNIADSLPVKLTLTYQHYFFCSKKCQKNTFENCSKITGQPYGLICFETVTLIRPKILADQWRKEQYKQGYIDLTIKEFGIEHARTHITSVMPFISGACKTNSYNKDTELVTGIFKRHSLNVYKYTFKNTDTGKFSILRATPNHRFYVKDRQAFLAIKNITKKDTLITSNGSSIKRVYFDKNTEITDSDKTNIPTLVYNLEIQKKHTYFAGSDNILVHNTCRCGKCGAELQDPDATRSHIIRSHVSSIKYTCGINGCKETATRIHFINQHQLNDHKVYNINSCQLCGAQCQSREHLIEHLTSACMFKVTGPCEKKFQSALYLLKKVSPKINKQSQLGIILRKNTPESRMILAFFLSDPSLNWTDHEFDKRMVELDDALPDIILL